MENIQVDITINMKFLSPRALKASLSSGPLEITLVVAHLHYQHTRRQSAWKDIAKELHGPNLILSVLITIF